MVVVLTLVLFATWLLIYIQREIIRDIEERVEVLEFNQLWRTEKNEETVFAD